MSKRKSAKEIRKEKAELIQAQNLKKKKSKNVKNISNKYLDFFLENWIFFFAILFVLIINSSSFKYLFYKSEEYISIEANVVKSEYEKHSAGASLDLIYEYSLNNKVYSNSKNYKTSHKSVTPSQIKEIYDLSLKYRVGSIISVYYNKFNPEESSTLRLETQKRNLLLVCSLILLIIIVLLKKYNKVFKSDKTRT